MKTITVKTGPEEIRRINDMLKQAGIVICCDHELSLEIDPRVFRQFSSRNAGRHYKPLKENGFLAHITKGEVRRRMKTETAAEIAESLGISRRTLFRRLKETERDDEELL